MICWQGNSVRRCTLHVPPSQAILKLATASASSQTAHLRRFRRAVLVPSGPGPRWPKLCAQTNSHRHAGSAVPAAGAAEGVAAGCVAAVRVGVAAGWLPPAAEAPAGATPLEHQRQLELLLLELFLRHQQDCEQRKQQAQEEQAQEEHIQQVTDFLLEQYRAAGQQPDTQACVALAATLAPLPVWRSYSQPFGAFMRFCLSEQLPLSVRKS